MRQQLLSTIPYTGIPADDPIRAAFPGLPQNIPTRVDRATAAALICAVGVPVSPRSLERWPLEWKTVNGRATGLTRDFLAEAKRMLDAAPTIRGGRARQMAAA